jgi:hypothetical protein
LGTSSMPKGRHAVQSKVKKAGSSATTKEEVLDAPPGFVSHENTRSLLTLLFDTKEAQHSALSRIEAFYESSQNSQRYLTLAEAKEHRQCEHYEAYNFPLVIVRTWLNSMEKVHYPDGRPSSGRVKDDEEDEDENVEKTQWWKAHCSVQEIHLLAFLDSLDLLEEPNSIDPTSTSTSPVYLISTLSSKQASLRHERLHFLYYISPTYRKKVEEEFESLSSKARKIVERDLTMRKYSPQVWIDEFQAYVSEDAGEFGNSVKQECQDISQSLQMYQREIWKGLQ